MIARRLGVPAAALTALVLAALLAGCGSSRASRTPTLADVPLVTGAKVAAQVRRCDTGSNAYCAIEFVVLDPLYKSSDQLTKDEAHQLRKSGWSIANGDTGVESAANSPSHGLRVTYASAMNDLRGVDLGWIRRPRTITLALSNTMFDRSAAMSMMLEVGAS
ncbi:MAG TPA: hypothetical protein VHX88_12250 [Solirubrobacteraceae bacterium]|jgi:hypothetical protein|nr:hypothetical protein [Solirubrobacteraceae bacterium]